MTDSFTRADDAVLRRAVRDDVPSLARLYVRSQGQVGTAADRHGITYDAVAQWMLKALLTEEILLLEREFGEVVGVVAISGDEIDVLDVEPTLQGRGYGSRLVSAAKATRPGGLVARIGNGRPAAQQFLAHHGFESMSHAGSGYSTLSWGPRLRRFRPPAGW